MTAVFTIPVFPRQGGSDELPVLMQAKGAEVGFRDTGLMRGSRHRELAEGWSGYKPSISHSR